MKIACHFAGNPRSFKRCYPSFKENIIDTLNPHIFIHTWRQTGLERPDVTTDGTPEEYIDLYKPNAYQIDDANVDYQPLYTMVPHFTSRFRCKELRQKYELENNIKYDIILMCRSDVKLINSPEILNGNSRVLGSKFKKEYLDLVKKNELWVHHFKSGIPGDYFFYGPTKWMDTWFDCYYEMDKLNIYHPGSERLAWYYLQKQGFKRENFKYFGNSIHDQDHIENSFRFFDIECVR